jgi:predicted HAD superfamily Cof-like phosphohydrolase
MSNVFKDQETFMLAGDQSVGTYNEDQFKLYLTLIEEEHQELKDAVANNDRVEALDAILDTIVVLVGAAHSLGVDAEGGWNEVIRSNMSKVDPASGKLLKRADGKVLKPEGFTPPNLVPFVHGV